MATLHQKSGRYPEGGYGWIIVISCVLINFLTMSIIQGFGIVLKVTFSEIYLSATEISVLISLYSSFGLFIGPLIGLMQKLYGCRKTAFLAAFLTTLGMICTSLSTSFISFLFSYGIITSLGTQMMESTDKLVVSSYFMKKRSIASGIIMTFAGLASILMPQLFQYLLKTYTCHQTILIFAGMLTHLFISAILMQPVEWHLEKSNSTANKQMIELKNPKQRQKTIKKFFDLELLKDPIFCNIVIGISLIYFAEINFLLLLPFILYDFGLNIDQVATFYSIVGTIDLVSRFVSPYIGNYFGRSSRFMYAMALVILTLTKFILIYCNSFEALKVIAVVVGCARGFRKVFMWLVLPDYVPLEKLPTASGINMLLRAVFTLAGGVVLGVLRDTTGSYKVCIFVMNGVVIACLLSWTLEVLIIRYKKKKTECDCI